MRKMLISLFVCVFLLAAGGTALGQGSGIGWFDFVTDLRAHGQVWLLSTLQVDSTSDLKGNVSDTEGVFTVADNAIIDGQADAVQLTVQGYTTQTTLSFVVENSGGTDVATISNAGALVIASTSDLQGNVSDSGGVLTVADNAIIDGAADAVQLTVQGYTTQTSASFVVENSSGTDLVTVSNTGLLTADDVTSVDDVTVGDDLGVGGWETITAQTTIVVSDGSTVTPLGTYVPISSTANTGTSDIANPTAGRLLIITNVAATTITFTDTGTLKLSGNAALSQYDVLQLLGDGTNWLQIAPEGDN